VQNPLTAFKEFSGQDQDPDDGVKNSCTAWLTTEHQLMVLLLEL
jgi:hypothetical protein